MTTLLVIIVLILLSVALWQLTKIFDLTQVGESVDSSEVANHHDNNIQGYLMFGFLAFIYIITIYCCIYFGNLPLMDHSASVHGILIDSLMWTSMILIFVVQTITQALLHWFAFKYRGNTPDKKALYYADNDKLEFIWSAVPAVVLAGLILYGLYAWTNIMYIDQTDKSMMVIEVYGKQFQWEARYSGADNVLGKANVRYIEGINTMGVDLADPNAQDDVTAMELHIPKGKKVLFKFRSQDVLHSAYFPHFRAQMNVVPGMVTEFAFEPIYTTAEMRELPYMQEKVENINRIRAKRSAEAIDKGDSALDPYSFDYFIACNKICGASHYNMQMKVVVDTPENFRKWMQGQATLIQKWNEQKANAAEEGLNKPVQTTTDGIVGENQATSLVPGSKEAGGNTKAANSTPTTTTK
ncbi:MAG TPA: cytochrome c oxidase subunit II [Flavobacterium sp.]|jgi:cytochrome c oxidase subunit 2